ncbi:hypothetical protein Dimus_037480 [Dionaea muscipula]
MRQKKRMESLKPINVIYMYSPPPTLTRDSDGSANILGPVPGSWVQCRGSWVQAGFCGPGRGSVVQCQSLWSSAVSSGPVPWLLGPAGWLGSSAVAPGPGRGLWSRLVAYHDIQRHFGN